MYKEEYEKPFMEVLEFEKKDIVIASCTCLENEPDAGEWNIE